MLSDDEVRIRHAVRCSPFARRLLSSSDELLSELPQTMHRPWLEQEMRDWLAAQQVTEENTLKQALRKLRQRVMLRTIVRDLNGMDALDFVSNFDEVVHTMSSLAEVAVQFALQHLTPWQEALYGAPMSASKSRQELIVVGMGKFGGRELNVSSDVDLIFAYEEGGETSGGTEGHGVISNHEFFLKLSKKLIAALDETTQDGFVFRVDMRLRPYGTDGPLACSFAMLEDYYQNQGREWERYAWIKGRVIAGPGEELARMLRPFVFRKYLDYGAFASMRDLKIQIQRDVNRRDMHDNIKLGRGGIREIEFIAQVFQLIRGGRDASLQIRPTLDVLQVLQRKGLLSPTTVEELSSAYMFLRNLEHRLQYVEDAQTHSLPTTPEAQARIALAAGYADWPSLKVVLEKHRAVVQQHFDEVFKDAPAQSAGSEYKDAAEVWQGVVPEPEIIKCLHTLGYKEATETLRRLTALRSSSRYRQLPPASRQRFDVLVPIVVTKAVQEANPDQTLSRTLDMLDSICRRASYLALLAESPAALTLVVKLVGASPWLAQYLAQHPILLDELLDTRNLYATPDFSQMYNELKRQLAEVEGDIERQMDTMRHFKHATVFRFAAQDIAGELRLEKLSDYLSALADMILQVTIETLWPTIRGKHRDIPQFAIIGYGKLGGKELGYASDLDIIFLYDDDVPGAGEVYARLGQRINTWLGSMTAAGTLYETDIELRPDGASGLLVSSIQAFREYQLQKAWTWEHQALTRARYCAGDSSIGHIFETIRHEVLTQHRDVEKLREEVVAMRQKMLDAHPNNSQMFDLKHDRGGIIDVEFMVQFLVLAYAHKHPELTGNLGNIALLKQLGNLGLVDSKKAAGVAAAYRLYRRMQHAIRLQGETRARVPQKDVKKHMQTVLDLWQQVFQHTPAY
ncbi:MAG TPA: bifunctional [glutamate--ammonia ligase]-adenylyl-L-tyrosine phosphorylase/[glutamate--ammonia-ligase] adenylyltransferase [Methylophilaceae bacterium]|nr:bifunctional [glutamate--ammonia ligase]-adenylyl-L-tyrosine phosphorylase/[glutamate--ammonia-ligase] adenylyltransferase [Methylophilaceae bacterium]